MDITTSTAVKRLSSLCSVFTSEAARQKVELLELLETREIRASYLIKRLHASLCYLRAFPDNKKIYTHVCALLDNFAGRILKLDEQQLEQLEDSGIAQTRVCYPFAYTHAAWLVRNYPECVEIDWNSSESTEKLDKLLQLLASPAEQHIFEEQILATDEYLCHARGKHHLSELDLFFRLCAQSPQAEKYIEALYDPSDVQIAWNLQDCAGSITRNCLAIDKVSYRKTGMRKLAGRATTEICKPMPVMHLSRKDGAVLLDVVNAALLVRSREVYHMQYSSADAVYLGSCGKGIQIAFMGALPERRFSLDVSFGYMVFANGVPVAYGGISPLFAQGNTGLNVLDEYRKGESAFIYTQVLRMGHSLFACRRFIVNPYQFGEDNADALRSGAFWFYYRLGFRPVDELVSKLSEKEYKKISGRRAYRSPLPVLKRLASCDMHLLLPGARKNHFFREDWLGVVALGAASLIARQGMHHHEAVSNIVEDVAQKLGITDRRTWSKNEREQLRRLAPVCGLIDDLPRWRAGEKRALIKLIREKGAPSERGYARSMATHTRFLAGLRRYCLESEKLKVKSEKQR